MKKLTVIAVLSILICTACVNQNVPREGDTNSLEGLQQMGARGTASTPKKNASLIREEAVRETALTVGAQAGLAYRAEQLNKVLNERGELLSRVFNFRAMMLPHNVLPPVLSEGRQSLNLADNNTIRLADRVYKIESQARFVTGVPDWRDYLAMNFSPPERPNDTLLPKTHKERAVWKENIEIAWRDGFKQAESIYLENLARLKRDYNGMVLYRKLLAQGMVSAPYVAKTNLGVTGGGSDMRVNDQVLRITALPNLQPQSKNWQPVFTK